MYKVYSWLQGVVMTDAMKLGRSTEREKQGPRHVVFYLCHRFSAVNTLGLVV
jgi:hypothetical protein